MDIININLLPWRQEKKNHEYRQYYIHAGLVFISFLLIVMLIYVYLKQCTQNQIKLNLQLEKHRTILNKTFTHLKYKQAIHQLYANKSLTQDKFKQLIPEREYS